MRIVAVLCAHMVSLGVVQAHGGHRDWTKPPTPPGVISHSITYALDGKVNV